MNTKQQKMKQRKECSNKTFGAIIFGIVAIALWFSNMPDAHGLSIFLAIIAVMIYAQKLIQGKKKQQSQTEPTNKKSYIINVIEYGDGYIVEGIDEDQFTIFRSDSKDKDSAKLDILVDGKPVAVLQYGRPNVDINVIPMPKEPTFTIFGDPEGIEVSPQEAFGYTYSLTEPEKWFAWADMDYISSKLSSQNMFVRVPEHYTVK